MKIAVIGAGISGVLCARLLQDQHDVTVFEACDAPGGHVKTVRIPGPDCMVDVGVSWYHPKTYPKLTRMLSWLGVDSRPAEMSYQVVDSAGKVRVCRSNSFAWTRAIRQLLCPFSIRAALDHWRIRGDVCKAARQQDLEATLRSWVRRNRPHPLTVTSFWIPAITFNWSISPEEAMDLPICVAERLFRTRMNTHSVPQHWRNIQGGAWEYMRRLVAPLSGRLLLSTPVRQVRRLDESVEIDAANRGTYRFDRVIFAVHSGQALAMLARPTDEEREILGGIPYRPQFVHLHSSFPLADNEADACSIIFRYREDGGMLIGVNLGRVLGNEAARGFFLSAGASIDYAPADRCAAFEFETPLITSKALKHQSNIDKINGHNRSYFCGAYCGDGQHEAAIESALSVAASFGKSLDDLFR